MLLEEVGAEQDPRHLDRIAGALRLRDRSHERLVVVLDVGVHHVEVALVDGHVDRLADRAARVVQPRRRVGELDEVLEVGERGVPASAGEVAHERRAVGGREHDVVAADHDRLVGVASVLGELAWRGRRPARGRGPARSAPGCRRSWHPRPRNSSRSAVSLMSIPTSASSWSALASIRSSPSGVSRSYGLTLRRMNAGPLIVRAVRSLTRASRPPPRRVIPRRRFSQPITVPEVCAVGACGRRRRGRSARR